MDPEFRFYISADGTPIAYATLGSGRPLVVLLGWATSFEAEWKDPEGRAWTEELAAGRQLVRCERRGAGPLTQHTPDLSVDAQAGDLAALVDHLELARVDLFGAYDGAAVVAHYASAFPDRVGRLVLWSPFVRGFDLADPEAMMSLRDLWKTNWKLARRGWAGVVFPGDSSERARWYNEMLKDAFTPDVAAAYTDLMGTLDITDQLSRVQAPTIVIARREDRLVPAAASRVVASLIRDARFIPADGDEGYPPFGDSSCLSTVKEFLDGGQTAPNGPGLRSGTSVILFTDIVDSTLLTERMGDVGFRTASRGLDRGLREAIAEFGGTPVEGKVLGDGVMGVFTSATKAIDAARRCLQLSEESTLSLHIGLHAGDVIGEGTNVYGGAVNIASRICSLSEPGELLVSQTVRDLARTSANVSFEDRGAHALKGIVDPVRVFAVQPESA